MKLRFVAELDYDETSMHGEDPESIAWFMSDVIFGELLVHSNEIGDTVGEMRVIEICKPPSPEELGETPLFGEV